MSDSTYQIDNADRRLIGALRRGGRLSNSDLARSLGMARGTVQSRLHRLVDTGVITGWGPDLDPRTSDLAVTAFTTLTIAQGAHDRVVAALEATPEVMEVHVITGAGDLLCRLAARSNDHLHDVIQAIVATEGVLRSSSQLALHTPLRRTLADLVGR
ncbi:MAG: Lrp/AsnC family transcriptional regulator [Ilumatobacter sp.]|uniref:Lrp/AsnC family transcriptional regulator n=1 Tax=Ilumatobacter sp. TaxID=1967498 RepID=UPI002626C25B|nr:Lrp/AsnC family transcriptional regulator [Ilumatobacter sp.]MDJ0767356.1 Lrp/AsnC family transcriptional regulator [Ilumatobacter sp.]